MNKEDKVKRIQKYCSKTLCNSDCRLDRICSDDEDNKVISAWSDKSINEAYDIISGNKSAKNMPDTVNHPAHYETGKYNSIDVMIETQGADTVANFCICNAFKYLYRWKNKNGIEDIKKAQWYIGKFLELQDQLEDK